MMLMVVRAAFGADEGQFKQFRDQLLGAPDAEQDAASQLAALGIEVHVRRNDGG